jgi:hypothetical protein
MSPVCADRGPRLLRYLDVAPHLRFLFIATAFIRTMHSLETDGFGRALTFVLLRAVMLGGACRDTCGWRIANSAGFRGFYWF